MTRPADSADSQTAERRRAIDESPPSVGGRELRARFQKACAIAHGRGAGMSANEMLELVLEHGLPPREERERILRSKLESAE